MKYKFRFFPYQRRFRQPLQTSHGTWDVREGIIIGLMDETGRIGWGEIAPLPWFGSETLAQALTFCQQLPTEVTITTIFSISAALPACQFGFESAFWDLKQENKIGLGQFPIDPRNSKLYLSYLLPSGALALTSWQTPWHQGYHTFKWKIGVTRFEEERRVFERLIQALPASVQLRLDGNGGLTFSETEQWLNLSDQTGRVEFIEQPLPPEALDSMWQISKHYSTPIALDESVATLEQLEVCYQNGWRGIFIIKAAIAGSPYRLRQFCHTHRIDAVFSSVFETTIGRTATLDLAAELSNPNRAVGFGINHWFMDDDESWIDSFSLSF